MDNFKKVVQISLKKLHNNLGIRQNFIVDLHDEKDSWSFISKFAQFIEGLFTKTIVQRLDEEATYNVISNLPQSVRLDLAFDLNLITKEEKSLFLTIAEIRNDYIHNLSNVEVTLTDYLKTLKTNRIKEIYKRFKPFLNKEITSHEDFVENCMNVIFSVFCVQIEAFNNNIEAYVASRKNAQHRAKQAERLLPKKADGVMYLTDIKMVNDYVSEAREVLKRVGLFKSQFPSDKSV